MVEKIPQSTKAHALQERGRWEGGLCSLSATTWFPTSSTNGCASHHPYPPKKSTGQGDRTKQGKRRDQNVKEKDELCLSLYF